MKNLLEMLSQKEKLFRGLEREIWALRICKDLLMEDEDRDKLPQPTQTGPQEPEKRWP